MGRLALSDDLLGRERRPVLRFGGPVGRRSTAGCQHYENRGDRGRESHAESSRIWIYRQQRAKPSPIARRLIGGATGTNPTNE